MSSAPMPIIKTPLYAESMRLYEAIRKEQVRIESAFSQVPHGITTDDLQRFRDSIAQAFPNVYVVEHRHDLRRWGIQVYGWSIGCDGERVFPPEEKMLADTTKLTTLADIVRQQ